MAFERDEEIRQQFVERPPHRRGAIGGITIRLPHVIGITGRKRHGKNTAAEALVPFGYEVVGFADELKAAALQLDPIVLMGFDLMRLSEIVSARGWEGAKGEPEVRRTLQLLGTEVVRQRDPDFWIRSLDRRVGGRRIVVADMRFDNEAEWVRSRGGLVIEVVRPELGDDIDSHSSEAGISRHLVDIQIANDGTPEDLHWAVRQFVTTPKEGITQ